MRSLVRPLTIDNRNYSISETGALPAEGIPDVTKATPDEREAAKMTASQWQRILQDGGYDYVLLYNLDDEFRRAYSCLFLEPETINEDTLYRVLENGRLEYVPFDG